MQVHRNCPIWRQAAYSVVDRLVDFLNSRYSGGDLYDILRHFLNMDHSEMEALGFQLRDYYEEAE